MANAATTKSHNPRLQSNARISGVVSSALPEPKVKIKAKSQGNLQHVATMMIVFTLDP